MEFSPCIKQAFFMSDALGVGDSSSTRLKENPLPMVEEAGDG